MPALLQKVKQMSSRQSNPARQSRLAAMAFYAQASGQAPALEQDNTYIKLKQQLMHHRVQLHAVQSITDKAKLKAEFLPEYDGYIDGVLAAGAIPVGDDVYTTLLVWTIDAGDLNRAVEMAELVFNAADTMLSVGGFERTAKVAVFEEIADQLAKGAAIDVDVLQSLVELAQQKNGELHALDMPDKVRAKFFKAAGEYFETQKNKAAAIGLYETALQYDDKIGVKQKLAALNKPD